MDPELQPAAALTGEKHDHVPPREAAHLVARDWSSGYAAAAADVLQKTACHIASVPHC